MPIIKRFRNAIRAFRNDYVGAGLGRRTRKWYAPNSGPNAALIGDLPTLINRSRAAIRNDPYAQAGINRLVSNIIGTGIKPKSMASDAALRDFLQNTFLTWTDESDADGLLDFYGQQNLACRALVEAGECFVRFRVRRPSDGLTVPLQLQLLESEFVPIDYNEALSNGNTIKAGIEFNRIGQRVAYWMHTSHPNEDDITDISRLTRVPAEEVLHLYEPLRIGQLRGQPVLAPVLLRMFHLDKFDDATLFRQEIANLFTGFITRSLGEDGDIDPLTGRPIIRDDDDLPMVELEPGTMQELAPGEEVEFSKPPDSGSNYPDFMRQQLMATAAGMGLPYELLTGDMRDVSDRALRVILNEFRRRIQQIQHHIFVYQLCRPVWNKWVSLLAISGQIDLLTTDLAETKSKVKWIPQGWAYIHPVQDVQAQSYAVRNGFKSRSEVVSEQGYDSEQIDAEIAADNERADSYQLNYDSDPRTSNH